MNAGNPLDQLKDIHLPEAVGFWPPALGWWLMALLLIAVLTALALFYKHYQKNAYRRAAVQQAKSLFNEFEPQHSHTFTSQLNQLLKAVALHRYNSEKISRLSNSQWLDFLDNSANMQAFSQGPGQILASAPYDKNSQLDDATALQKCCLQWIRSHR